MKDYILEGCVDSVESAVAAQAGGANRLELCGNLVIGGTTPDINLFLAVREKVSIKINVLIRPRFGDFCYTEEEFGIVKKDVEMFRKHGADGVVIGVLKEDGNLDVLRMKELMEAAGGMSVTLHRAFDVCRDPFQTLKDAENLHIQTILTSGQKNSCYEGRELIGQLVAKTAGKVDILVGSGVNSAMIEELAAATKAKSFHLSGKVNAESAMTYRKEDVSMGLPLMSEYKIYRTDASEIAKVRDVLQRL
nr:copper homeostasis protein CutC [uncultured Caproiciproducens sp.]